jgi:SAM-dependent methyltransferase
VSEQALAAPTAPSATHPTTLTLPCFFMTQGLGIKVSWRARAAQCYPPRISRFHWIFVASSLLAVSCGYPARDLPEAWRQIDRDKPLRQPDVPYEPSSDRAIQAMLELAQPRHDDVVYDLGCGDGRVVIEAVHHSGARGVGVDLDPKLVRQAEANAARAGVSGQVSFRTADLFATDLREASVVLLFLWPEINRRLLPKLLRELRPGARIVSNMHDMGDYTPSRRITLRGGAQPHHVYLWVVPSTSAK